MKIYYLLAINWHSTSAVSTDGAFTLAETDLKPSPTFLNLSFVNSWELILTVNFMYKSP